MILKTLLTKHLPAVKTWMDVSPAWQVTYTTHAPTWLAQWGHETFQQCPLWHTQNSFISVQSKLPPNPDGSQKGLDPMLYCTEWFMSIFSRCVRAGLCRKNLSQQWKWICPSGPFPGRRYWECGTCSFLREWRFSIRSLWLSSTLPSAHPQVRRSVQGTWLVLMLIFLVQIVKDCSHITSLM